MKSIAVLLSLILAASFAHADRACEKALKKTAVEETSVEFKRPADQKRFKGLVKLKYDRGVAERIVRAYPPMADKILSSGPDGGKPVRVFIGDSSGPGTETDRGSFAQFGSPAETPGQWVYKELIFAQQKASQVQYSNISATYANIYELQIPKFILGKYTSAFVQSQTLGPVFGPYVTRIAYLKFQSSYSYPKLINLKWLSREQATKENGDFLKPWPKSFSHFDFRKESED